MNEYVPDGGWNEVRRNFQKALSSSVDTGGRAVGVRFGNGTASFTASATTGDVTVSHGLGKTPEYINVFAAHTGAVAIVSNYVALSRDEDSFQFRLTTRDAGAITADVGYFWIVLG